jgi:hypothetical protein
VRPLLPLVTITLAGCHPAYRACEGYLSAVEECLTSIDAGDERRAVLGAYSDEQVCAPLRDDAGRGAGRVFRCYTDTLDEGDCADPAGWDALIAGLRACEADWQ